MMERPEYMRIHGKYFLPDMRAKYNIDELIDVDGYVYCKIKRGMYGLRQAARLAWSALVKNLAQEGYHHDKFCHNIWSHNTRPTKFCLCVDDFGVKYYSTDDANHLITTLKKSYDITIDHKGEHFCGLTIKWNYDKKYVDISMKNYVIKALQRLQHTFPSKPQYAPHKWTVPIYGSNRQYAPDPDSSPLLPASDIKKVQSVVGTFLYYARAIDNTILPALNEISASQAKPTQKTTEKINMLLDYLSTYPDAKIRYFASDMILTIDSDAAYLVAPKARSRVAGYFHCSTKYDKVRPSNVLHNGPIHIECTILKRVLASAAEVETAGLFHNCQTAVHLCRMLEALAHQQPATPTKTDNSTAASFVTDTLKKKRSKSWDKDYHWLCDQQALGNFYVYWDKGSNNKADYHTKHFSPTHHLNVRPTYILKGY